MINKLQKQLNKLWHEQINYDMKEIIEEFDKKKNEIHIFYLGSIFPSDLREMEWAILVHSMFRSWIKQRVD